MRVLEVSKVPSHRISYEAVDKRRRRVTTTLPILRGVIDHLPKGLDAMILAGDLQGREKRRNGRGGCSRLLGEVLVDELVQLSGVGQLPPLDRVGIVLTGDLFVPPGLNTRSGNGDVCPVWRAFARQCPWVAGVAGNHDQFGKSPHDLEVFRREPGIHYLDRDIRDVGGVRIGGVSGVIGHVTRPFRKTQEEFIKSMRCLLSSRLDLLLLHEGPNDPVNNFQGNALIREELATRRDLLCCFGHSHWDEPLRELRNGCQLLNVENRVVVLTQAKLRIS